MSGSTENDSESFSFFSFNFVQIAMGIFYVYFFNLKPIN